MSQHEHPERSDYIERVRDVLITGQGFRPEQVPADDAIGSHVDRAVAVVNAEGGWSVVALAVETIKQAYYGRPGEEEIVR